MKRPNYPHAGLDTTLTVVGSCSYLMVFMPSVPLWLKIVGCAIFLVPVVYRVVYSFRQKCYGYGWLMAFLGVALVFFAVMYCRLMSDTASQFV